MSYPTAEARQDLLDALADSIELTARALSGLGAAYELLDEGSADRLEEELFRPVQSAFGKGQRTYAGFALRHAMKGRTFTAPESNATRPARELLEGALEAIADADATLIDLQDSLLPVEVGDAPLRAELAELREIVGPLAARGEQLERVLGR